MVDWKSCTIVRFFFLLFVEKYNDFILIDGTRKTNIYDLSLLVTTVVDSLGVSVPIGLMVAPSEI